MQTMTRENIEQRVKEILIEEFECPAEKLTPDVNLFTDLELDSIDAVDLVVKLQNMTSKRIDPDQFKAIRTLADVTHAVEKVLND